MVTLGPKDAHVAGRPRHDGRGGGDGGEAARPRRADGARPPGTHTTDSVDWDVILSGEVWLEVDNGERTLLQTGDCVVLNGTRHSWHNESDQPCTMISAVIGAERRT